MAGRKKAPQKTAATQGDLLKKSYELFTKKNIETVSMIEIARECGYGTTTLYRYYSTKPKLVVAVSTWAWSEFTRGSRQRLASGDWERMTAAERFAFFLDTFLDLYRDHRDLLRFNQFFNVYVRSEEIPPEQMSPYIGMVRQIIEQFHATYAKGQSDGTLRTEVPEQEMISAAIHLMLAAATRYAVGLVYTEGLDPEKELLLLRDMLMDRFTIRNNSRNRTCFFMENRVQSLSQTESVCLPYP